MASGIVEDDGRSKAKMHPLGSIKQALRTKSFARSA